MGIFGKLFELNDRVGGVESTFNNFLSCRYAIASHHESGCDRSEALLAFYFIWIFLFFLCLFGVSELMPLCLNLATVRFNVNGYLDSHAVGKFVLYMAKRSHSA